MELEPAHPVIADQASRLVDSVRLVGVDARERDEDVGVGGRDLRNLFVSHGRATRDGLGVDGEHDSRHVPLAVVGGDVLHRRLATFAEVLHRGLAPFGTQAVLAGAADLGVRVDVDGDHAVDVDRQRSSALPSFRTAVPCPLTDSKP